MNKKQTLKAYLNIFALITSFTLVAQVVLSIYIYNNHVNYFLRELIIYVSCAVLFIMILICFLLSSGSYLYKPFDEWLKNTDKSPWVVGISFGFILCSALFIFQAGGVQNCPLANILVLNASLGPVLAKNSKVVRYSIVISCLCSYALCSVFYLSPDTERLLIHPARDFVFYIAMALFVFAFSVIIALNTTYTKKKPKEKSPV